ncbi:glycosyltransferase family 2 protein [Acidimangrovimonas pyrenivorans]|uniref:Glycosyltransferase family 2 protein n=1 Tax=Acidimangrovimonas pyrenivorans TaxID=2030798 RepID=A0ABV7AN04_9RHOB
MTDAPLLSVLVPAYEYAEGVERILQALEPLSPDVELLIFDDSPAPDMAGLIEAHASRWPDLRYRHNPSALGGPLGAGNNWNALLDAARGRYCLLMHHDEMPLGREFCSRLRAALTDRTAPEVLLLDVVLLDGALRPLRRHVPAWLRWSVVRYAPGYLFRRNVIGPTASLVVRREHFPRFDPSLRWLIDVELYVRLCRAGLRWQRLAGLEVGSIQRSDGTITASLSGELHRIDAAERVALRPRFPRDRLWLGAPVGGALRAVEQVLWLSLRVVERAWTRLVRLKPRS